jgi:hypothetical protein
MILAVLASTAAFAGADLASLSSIEVAYEVVFDLGQLADMTCATTQICDCTASYTGTGTAVAVQGDRVTFEGRWTVAESSCNDMFLLWTGGQAATSYHTVRFDPGHDQVLEWVAHAHKDKPDRLTEGIKAGKQAWLADMALVWDGATRTLSHTESESDSSSGIPIATKHTLTLSFGGPS